MPKTIALVLLWALSVSAAYAETFKFTAIPDQNKEVLMRQFGKVARYLSDKLGVEVQYVPVATYNESIEAFAKNEVQLAWFGGLSGVQARFRETSAEAIAQGEEDMKFKTYFIAHADSGLEPGSAFPDGIAGKSFSFGSEDSTSGRLMPEYFIRRHFNKTPAEVFAKVGFSGDHSRTIEQVQNGTYQVGAVNFMIWKKELAAGKIDIGKIKVIWESPPFPDYHWTVRGDVDTVWGAGFTEKLKQVLFTIQDPKIMAAFERKSFVPTSQIDYAPILETAANLGLLP